MTAVRSPVCGLSSQDLESIRGSLAAGRRPKVLFTAAAGQIAGQSGQVVALTDPQLSEEWVVVRFGRDELPFSPGDLAVPSRAPTARREPVPTPGPRRSADGRRPSTPRQQQEQEEQVSKPASAPPAAEAPAAPAAVDGSAPPDGSTGSGGDGRPARRGPGRPPRPRPPAALTVTLAYADGEWTVAATQGTKPLAKPYLIRPAEALKMVGMLDVPGVHEAVEQILATERAGAEQQAQRLRAELAEIEARLAELRAVG